MQDAQGISEQQRQALFQLATEAHRAGRFEEALKHYQALQTIDPENHRMLSNMGTLYLQSGVMDRGMVLLKASLEIREDQPHAHNSLGNALSAMDQLEMAREHYRRAIALSPDFTEAHAALASCLCRLQDFEGALDQVLAAISLAGERVELRLLRASILKDLGQWGQAIFELDAIVSLDPGFFEAHRVRGDVLALMERKDEALVAYRNALEINPRDALTLISGSLILDALNRKVEALEWVDLALAIEPHAYEALTNRGNLLVSLQRYPEAREDFDAAIRLEPLRAGAYWNRGVLSQREKADRLALHDFGQALALDGRYHRGLAHMLLHARKAMAFEEIPRILDQVRDCLARNHEVGCPFAFLAEWDDPPLHQKITRLYIEHGWGRERAADRPPRTSLRPHRLRLGYFSSDFRGHPVALNLLPILKAHDRDRFELVAFDFAPKATPKEERDILKAFDAVHFIQDLTDGEAAALSRDLGIDLAIDLNGHTEYARVGIFQQNAAPVQVNYLGYPGSAGTAWHDYLIADARVVPEEARCFYEEEVLHLPHFFMPYDFSPPQDFFTCRRADYGLEEKDFVFCSFNDFHKISESVLSAWVNMLGACEHAVLYLAKRGDIEAHEFRERFRSCGIDPRRVIFSSWTRDHSEHLYRLGLCDLMLDTFPYNSHTTACDAVKSGLPILTIRGRSFASRVSSSLLEEMDLPELIARDLEDYTQRAIRLALDRTFYLDVRQRLKEGRSRLKKTATYTRNLESLYLSMVAGK